MVLIDDAGAVWKVGVYVHVATGPKALGSNKLLTRNLNQNKLNNYGGIGSEEETKKTNLFRHFEKYFISFPSSPSPACALCWHFIYVRRYILAIVSALEVKLAMKLFRNAKSYLIPLAGYKFCWDLHNYQGSIEYYFESSLWCFLIIFVVPADSLNIGWSIDKKKHLYTTGKCFILSMKR